MTLERSLRLLDDTQPVVPTHSILGDRGGGGLANSSDGVVPYSSNHFPAAESEVVVPTGHGGFTHPDAVAELKRILKPAAAATSKPARGRVGPQDEMKQRLKVCERR